MSTAPPRRRVTLLADDEAKGERLDLFLTRSLNVSRKSIKRALDGGRVFVGERVVRLASHPMAGGETITITLDLPDEKPVVPPIPILYRDPSLLAINKPAGIPSHPTVAGRSDILSLVAGQLEQEGRETAPILLHRLDVDTTGLLLFALNSAGNRELARQFAERRVEKVYLAIVAGSMPDHIEVKNHLKAGPRGRTLEVASGGQTAETHLRLLARGDGFSLVEARPHTGRTHQIRVHLAGAGFPLLGDTLYGGPSSLRIGGREKRIGRYLLHAYRLTFKHPQYGRKMALEAPVPDDFRMIIDWMDDPACLPPPSTGRDNHS